MNFENLRLIVFDFDGVFTDNRVIVSQDGVESAICHRSDGLGMARVRGLGIEMMILSTEVVPIVQMRAKKLNVPCIHGCENKLTELTRIMTERRIAMENIAFVGNDINDLECLQAVGYPVCVQDAYPEVKAVCKLILSRKGGDGAVREFCDNVFLARSK